MSANYGGGATSSVWSTSGSGSFSDNSENAVYTPSSSDITNGTVILTYKAYSPSSFCNEVSDSLVLTIKQNVKITTQPSNVGACVNDVTSLSVVAFGDDLTYQWYKSGVAVTNGGNISGATTNELTFSPASLSNSGSYYVVVGGNSVCSSVTSNTVTLNINQLISITDQPDSLELCEGNTATFSVSATGSIASYQWRKNGVNISGATSSSLVINNVSPSNNGNYDVVITGSLGSCPNVISNQASLNVTLQPTASINYGSASYCKSFAGNENVVLNGTNAYQGGTFTVSPSGLTINASTGAITPSTSTPGNYTISYTMPTSVCPISPVTTTVSIYPITDGGEVLGYLDDETYADRRDVLTACHLGDGTLVLTGYTGAIQEWQYSLDGGLTWASITETSNTIPFNDITQATVYRAVIQSGNCTVEYSTNTIVNIIPPDVKPDPVLAAPTEICLGGSTVFNSQSGLGTGLGLEDGGGDFQTGQLNTQDPDSWLVDGSPGGWTANADSTKPNDWSGSNDNKSFPGGTFVSGNPKFGIANGPITSVLETPIFNTYGLTVFEFRLDQAYRLYTGDRILIELSVDGGATYNVTLQDISGPIQYVLNPFGNDNTVFTEDIYGNSLNNYVGQPELRVRLTFIGTQAESAWAIDNIQVEVDESDNGVEWTNEVGDIISTEHVATVTPPAPGIHTYGVTSLIEGCRSEGNDGTVFVDILVDYAYAGENQTILESECGNNTVILNAYDNTITTYENYLKGTYDAYDASDPLGNQPGTGTIGTWSIKSGPTSTCGTGTFSDINDPNATFTGESGTYVLTWTVGGCSSDVTVILTSCDNINFDGVDDYITFGDNYDLNSSFSIEAWIKPGVNNTNIQTILSKRDANSLTNGYDLRLVNRRLSFNWNNGGSITSPFNINTNRWYHVAVTFNGSTYKMYIDGIEVVSASGTTPSLNDFDCILGAMDQTGAPPNKPVNYFKGWMDELRIWNKALDIQHIRQMMNQQITFNGTAVIGEIVPINVNGPDANYDGAEDNVINWSNLAGYYRMDQTNCGYLNPYNGVGVDGKLRNITTDQPESAPLPYTTIRDGDWTDLTSATPWTYGNSVWDYPNSKGVNGNDIDWNIVVSSHKLTSDSKDITLLGYIDNANAKLTVAEPTEALNENNSGHSLFITHYLNLDGVIDLVGESQLIQRRYNDTQFSESVLNDNSGGYIERDQQGHGNLYWYNDWCSPVGRIGQPKGSPYAIRDVLKDGTVSSNPLDINFIGGYNGAVGMPISIAEYWLYVYKNLTGSYSEWSQVYSTGNMYAAEGFLMKGTGAATYQNYVFKGKPNNGDIELNVNANNTYLVGNPYACALDADQFIMDNLDTTTGVLYFWEHWGASTHVVSQYDAGYPVYTLAGGVGTGYRAVGVNDPTDIGFKTPGRYVAVAQAFYVVGNETGGNVKFKNRQRAYVTEADPTLSVFFKSSKSNKSDVIQAEKDTRLKIRVGLDAPDVLHRQVLLTFDERTTDNIDKGFDAVIYDVWGNDIYWLIENNRLVIQSVKEFSKERVVPIGISSMGNGVIKIKVDEIENSTPNLKVYLRDNSTMETFDILNETYEVLLEEGEYFDKYSIVFKKEKKIDEVVEEVNEEAEMIDEDVYMSNIQVVEEDTVQYNNLFVFVNSDNTILSIRKPDDLNIKDIMLFNVLGQIIKVWDENLNENEIDLSINLETGVFYVVINTDKGKVSRKIIIK